jgi:hypothetical protein
VRPLLRWISLLGCAAVLAVLGAANLHQRNFPLFLAAVVGVCAAAVAVFVATSPPRPPSPLPSPYPLP